MIVKNLRDNWFGSEVKLIARWLLYETFRRRFFGFSFSLETVGNFTSLSAYRNS